MKNFFFCPLSFFSPTFNQLAKMQNCVGNLRENGDTLFFNGKFVLQYFLSILFDLFPQLSCLYSSEQKLLKSYQIFQAKERTVKLCKWDIVPLEYKYILSATVTSSHLEVSAELWYMYSFGAAEHKVRKRPSNDSRMKS